MNRVARDGFCSERRRVLRILGETAGGLAGAAFAFAFSAGCAPSEEDGRTVVSFSDLPLDVRVRVMHGEHPIELLRTSSGVRARSLWCTHTGCEVRWSEKGREYLCPCHDGIFDSEGKVVGGPPPRPLKSYPVEVTGNDVLVGEKNTA